MHNLTKKEIEVLECIVSGYSLEEIAEELGVSKHTVVSHRKHILQKLRAKNMYHAIYLACLKGILYETGNS